MEPDLMGAERIRSHTRMDGTKRASLWCFVASGVGSVGNARILVVFGCDLACLKATASFARAPWPAARCEKNYCSEQIRTNQNKCGGWNPGAL